MSVPELLLPTRTVDYTVVTATDIDKLAEDVRRMIEMSKGEWDVGGPLVALPGHDLFYQPMVRKQSIPMEDLEQLYTDLMLMSVKMQKIMEEKMQELAEAHD